jgi:D-lactate dehydrogenase (cytochrome)
MRGIKKGRAAFTLTRPETQLAPRVRKSGIVRGSHMLITDVCVPISRLAECILETQEDIVASGIAAPIAGHVGDGNFHTAPVFDPNDAKELADVEGFVYRLAQRAISMDGTCTGEHGIGQRKTTYLNDEFGQGIVVMRSIKAALDPFNILNPDKIFPN